MTGPARQAINAYAITRFFPLLLQRITNQIGITDSHAPDKACRAKESTGRAGIGIDEIATIIIAISPTLKLCPARVTVVTLPLIRVSLLSRIHSERVADHVWPQAANHLLKVAAKHSFERTARQKHLIETIAVGHYRRHIRSADRRTTGPNQ